MVNNIETKNSMLNQVMKRNKGLCNHFKKVYFYHILINMNGEADIQANMACKMEEIRSLINGMKGNYPIP